MVSDAFVLPNDDTSSDPALAVWNIRAAFAAGVGGGGAMARPC